MTAPLGTPPLGTPPLRTPPLASLREALVAELGAEAVSDDDALRRKVSSDWSRMSPVLAEKVPPGRYVADLVVRPTSVEQVPRVLALAHAHGVPVTPRGAGTGNYGQATPFDGGVLLDLRGLTDVAVNDDGTLTAQAGAKLTDVDVVGRAAGRDIWIFPSTKGSTIGGFLAGGSAGTGTIEHGTTSDGWVVSVDVAPMDGSGEVFTAVGDDAAPYIHAYGVTGVVLAATVRTDPARDWTAVWAEFDSYDALVAVHRTLLDLPVLPRLASADEPTLVETLPTSKHGVAPDPSRHSLRVIAEASTAQEVARRVRAGGGEVVAVLDDYAATDELSSMSYNHPVYFRQNALAQAVGEGRAAPLFHMETGGLPLWEAPDAVRGVYGPSTLLHLELMGSAPLAMVVADYAGEEQVLAGIPRFDAIGVGVHSPHQWYVDRNVELVREVAARTDPLGLLNPGKLVAAGAGAGVDTRVTIGVRT